VTTHQAHPREPRWQSVQRTTRRTTLVERELWRIAVGCAALLLCTPMTPRTSRTYLPQSESGPGGGMTHSAGWDWIAPLLGIVALVNLIIGRRQRPGVVASVFSTMVASISLAVAAAAALGHWLDLGSGSLSVAGSVIRPAPRRGVLCGHCHRRYGGRAGAAGQLASSGRCRNATMTVPPRCPPGTPRWACLAGRAAAHQRRDYRSCCCAPPGRICCAPRST
jgi:hypothetical protein